MKRSTDAEILTTLTPYRPTKNTSRKGAFST